MRPLSVAVVGAGPAGIYAADILANSGKDVRIDLFESLPAPYGLVRYGVAPDHPRIKFITTALHKILDSGEFRLFGNVEVGKDVSLAEMQEHYDAIIFATGADRDAPLDIPGVDLPECYGAADFVYWYDGHPDHPREWPLEAKEVAVIGVGNVALDISRVLAKHIDDMRVTEIPENVEKALAASPVTDVHVFGRRGPAQAKFTPLELKELGKTPDVDVIVYEEDIDFDEGSQAQMKASNQTRQVVKTLTSYTLKTPEERTASRRIHLHFFHRPVEILGDEHVEALRTERTELTGDGTVRGTGEFIDTPVQAVYRAVGYFSSPVKDVPFDEVRGVIPNIAGRVTDAEGEALPGLYATGWVKRGPVGLIGETKSDAQETIACLIEDAESGVIGGAAEEKTGVAHGHDGIQALLDERGIRYTSVKGWELLDNFERALGEKQGRERTKVVERETMTAVSREEPHDGKLY